MYSVKDILLMACEVACNIVILKPVTIFIRGIRVDIFLNAKHTIPKSKICKAQNELPSSFIDVLFYNQLKN